MSTSSAPSNHQPLGHVIKRFGPESPHTGFWGPVTASVDWCETNYAVTRYIAEFFNSTSNVVTIAAGIFLFFRARKLNLERRYALAPLFLTLVGFGSLCFHGTLQYHAQLLDELPMFYMELIFSYIAIERSKAQKYPRLPIIMWAIGILYTIAHIYLRLVVTFHIIFGVLLILIQVLPFTYAKLDPVIRRSFLSGLAFLASAFTAWELDQIFCNSIEYLYLHAAWHAGTAIAGVLWLEIMMYIRLKYVYKKRNVWLDLKFGVFPVITFGEQPREEGASLAGYEDEVDLSRESTDASSSMVRSLSWSAKANEMASSAMELAASAASLSMSTAATTTVAGASSACQYPLGSVGVKLRNRGALSRIS
ncbi:ceramidase-domain-containing protein, partial [Catenaria anguillulae PL171]